MSMLSGVGATLQDRAYALRMDNDLSIRTISQQLGVPRSTVGDWLRGDGEAREMRDCGLCGQRFFATRNDAKFCTRRCKNKYRRVYGARSPR